MDKSDGMGWDESIRQLQLARTAFFWPVNLESSKLPYITLP